MILSLSLCRPNNMGVGHLDRRQSNAKGTRQRDLPSKSCCCHQDGGQVYRPISMRTTDASSAFRKRNTHNTQTVHASSVPSVSRSIAIAEKQQKRRHYIQKPKHVATHPSLAVSCLSCRCGRTVLTVIACLWRTALLIFRLMKLTQRCRALRLNSCIVLAIKTGAKRTLSRSPLSSRVYKLRTILIFLLCNDGHDDGQPTNSRIYRGSILRSTIY